MAAFSWAYNKLFCKFRNLNSEKQKIHGEYKKIKSIAFVKFHVNITSLFALSKSFSIVSVITLSNH